MRVDFVQSEFCSMQTVILNMVYVCVCDLYITHCNGSDPGEGVCLECRPQQPTIKWSLESAPRSFSCVTFSRDEAAGANRVLSRQHVNKS